MGWSRRGAHGRRGYHHGNLREALIEAALRLIADRGPGGLTFADAARLAGVSSAAPYRHFRDREQLLNDIARRGFEQFAETLDEAWKDGRPDPITAFERLGRTYLAFARKEPAFYSAMFEAGVSSQADPALRQAADDAFSVLRKASETLCSELPRTGRPPALMVSLHVWSLAHGVASLFARGDGGRRKLPMSPEELLEAGILVYLQGLGLLPGRSKGQSG
ncbi:MAG TPA: TetR/AcrR family transcriptional regulator [Alphaproteobacteria bacterium]|nr:TetR/AcrR family transcriptional regulator [Alphaproteobacteria bacterium]